jgi:predicted phosphoribosyltransferase
MIGMYQFANRAEAGSQLASALKEFAGKPNVIVVALPRGGVPVGHEVAKALGCPLDILVVRKLGVPGHDELAMGAIASGGICELNRQTIEFLGLAPEQIEAVKYRETLELLRRELVYRGDRPPLIVRGQTVLLVDDGLATGTTMRAAISALRGLGAREVVAAVPVGSAQSCRELRGYVDRLICLLKPEDLVSISTWYRDFGQTSDREVQELLKIHEPAHLNP